MNLFTSELFSSTMLQEVQPRAPRSYRESLFAARYGRRRADRSAFSAAPLLLAPGTVVRIGETTAPIDYDQAA